MMPEVNRQSGQPWMCVFLVCRAISVHISDPRSPWANQTLSNSALGV